MCAVAVTQGATDLIALLSIGRAKAGGDSKYVPPAKRYQG